VFASPSLIQVRHDLWRSLILLTEVNARILLFLSCVHEALLQLIVAALVTDLTTAPSLDSPSLLASPLRSSVCSTA
jgi:hypothetical protein